MQKITLKTPSFLLNVMFVCLSECFRTIAFLDKFKNSKNILTKGRKFNRSIISKIQGIFLPANSFMSTLTLNKNIPNPYENDST